MCHATCVFYKCVSAIYMILTKVQLYGAIITTPTPMPFDAFNDGDIWYDNYYDYDRQAWVRKSARYSELADTSYGIVVIIFHILMDVAVYASAIAVITSAIMLILNARNRIKLGESKRYVLQVFVVSVLIFSVTGIVNLVQRIAVDGF